jgi:HEAT repeat protein
LKIAAGIALLIGSFFGGKYQQAGKTHNEIAALEDTSLEMKELAMISLMENRSASKRIQGVGFIGEFSEPDPDILRALIQRMRYDENTNVRLTATEALTRFRHTEMVKEAFITALGTEKDPGIQIIMIKTLADIPDQKAIEPLKELMDREETQPFVKAEIETLLPKFL